MILFVSSWWQMLCVVDIKHLYASEYATAHAYGALFGVGVVVAERVAIIEHIDNILAGKATNERRDQRRK